MRSRKPSPQTLRVLGAFLAEPGAWRYGYDLTRDIGLASGTLYPVLMRLADQGLLTEAWHTSDRAGAPARHAYRLSPAGLAFAQAHVVISDERAEVRISPDTGPFPA